MLKKIINGFPLWAIIASIFAYVQPELFTPLKSYIIPLLMLIMLSMGLTLTFSDFNRVKAHLRAVTLGIILQFSIMPVCALLIAILFDLNEQLTIGMVLVGSVAGGTASNVICFLAKGNVALSITMTAISTLLGILMTPFLVSALVGISVDVPVTKMIISLVQIVLMPVAVGVILNHYLNKTITTISPLMPLISMSAIILAIAIIVALNQAQLSSVGSLILFAVVLHNGLGLLLGYSSCKLLQFDHTTCKTIAIEVGLQNSGLATALALKFFSPQAALPAAIFSVWHNISGSVLAYFWSKK